MTRMTKWRVQVLISVVALALTSWAQTGWAGPPQWQIQTTQDPGTTENFLDGVSTTSTSNAWVAGYSVNQNIQLSRALIEHYDGVSWQVASAPQPGRRSELNAVRATSATNAWAVGWWEKPGVVPERSLVEHWDGGAWTTQASASFTHFTTILNAIGASSATNAWAVGDGSNPVLFGAILHLENGVWRNVSFTRPKGESDLLGVTTLGASDVWAVGQATPSGKPARTWIEHWNGVDWTRVTSPNRGTKGSELFGVSANSSSDVWAVGESGASTSAPHTLIEHWDGAT